MHEFDTLRASYSFSTSSSHLLLLNSDLNKLPNDIISQIDSIDDILVNLDKSEAFQNGFRGSSDGKCVKMEQFPKGTVKIF